MNRRELVKTLSLSGGALMVGCAPTANPGSKVDKAGLKVAVIGDFPKVGSYKTFEVAGLPAIIVRSSSPQADGVSVGEVNLLAFSRQCTHLGCTVNEPVGDVMGCPCHGSLFNPQTAAVVRGPAGSPLPKIKLEARQDGIYAVPS